MTQRTQIQHTQTQHTQIHHTHTYRAVLAGTTVLAMAVLSLVLLGRPALADSPRPAAPTATSAPKAAEPATYDTFRREWLGHTRSLKIRAGRTAREVAYSGCCTKGADLVFDVSRVRGTVRHATLRAELAQVRYWDRDLAGERAPKVGTVVTIHLDRGVLTEPLVGTSYCNDKRAREGVCGA